MNGLLGVIPAAGLGKRLFERGGSKELLLVGTRPVRSDSGDSVAPRAAITYTLDGLVSAGVERAMVITNPGKLELVKYLLSGRTFDIDIAFVVEETSSMLESIDLAYPWMREDRIVLAMPDTIVQPSDAARQLVSFANARGSDLALGLFPVSAPERFGVIETDEDLNVVGHVDKPTEPRVANVWGLATWGPRFSELVHEVVRRPAAGARERVLGDAFDAAISAGLTCVGLAVPGGSYRDLGSYDDYREAVWHL